MPGIKDRYKLMKSKVVGGGFGDVHRAKRLSDGRPVAIKVLRDYKQPDCLQRFKREVTLLREYRHPGIVEVLDAELDASPPYYVMPLYGKTLKQRVGKLSPAEFITLLESLISVLAFLEERGAFHRDLKPDNILIDDDGKAVICDFGLGNDPALTENFTQHGAGTPGYVAPELMRLRNGATPKCDIYSLGATAFHLLTGVHPGDAESLDIAKYTPNFPDEIRSKILEMVNPEPTCRPGAKELLLWVRSLPQRIAAPVHSKIVVPVKANMKRAHAALDPFRSLFRWMPAFLVVLVALIGVIVFIARRPLRSARNAA